MALIYEAELKKQIRSKTPESCYLFYGSEEYLKQFYVNKIIKAFVAPGSETFSLRRYDGKENTLDEVLEGAVSVPFMSEYSVIVARDFPLDAFNAEQKDRLIEFLKNPPDTSVTIFWMDSVEVQRNAKWKWVTDNFTKYACAVDFRKPDMRELKKLVCAYAAKQGCSMQERDAAYLIEKCGDSLNTLFNEIMKVCSLAGAGAEITRAHIDSVAVPSLEAKVFDLSKLLLARNIQGAMELLHTLMLQKAEPIDVFGVILMSFVDIYRAKTALSGGESAAYPAGLFDYRNKEFRLTNGAKYARNLSNEQLRECFDCFAESDRLLKSTAQSGEAVLERLLVRLTLIISR